MQNCECRPVYDESQIEREFKDKKNRVRSILILVFIGTLLIVAWMVWQEWKLRVAYQRQLLSKHVQVMALQLHQFLATREALFKQFVEYGNRLFEQRQQTLLPVERYQKAWQEFLATELCPMLRGFYPDMLGSAFYTRGLYLVPEQGACGNSQLIDRYKRTVEDFISHDFASEKDVLISVHFLEKARRYPLSGHMKFDELYLTGIFRWKMPSRYAHLPEDGYVIVFWPASELVRFMYGDVRIRDSAYWFELIENTHRGYQRIVSVEGPASRPQSFSESMEQCDINHGMWCVKGYIYEKETDYLYVVFWAGMLLLVVLLFSIFLWRPIGDLYDDLTKCKKKLKEYESGDKKTGLYTVDEVKKKFLDRFVNRENPVCKEGYHGVCIMDVDHLRKINASYHYTIAGEQVMKKLADRCVELCEGVFREQGRQVIMARGGGDSIVALFPCIGESEEEAHENLEKVAEDLRRAGEFEVQVSTSKVNVTVSVGGALVKSDVHFGDLLIDELLKAADPWVDTAKRAGRNCWRIGDLQQREEELQQLEKDRQNKGEENAV